MDPKTLQRLLTYGSAVGAGGATALYAANQGDNPSATALKSILAGTGAALAGRYAPNLIREGALNTARGIKTNMRDGINKLRGTGALTAAVGVPVAALGGAGGLAAGMGAEALLRAGNIPGFRGDDPNVAQYEEALMSMDPALVDDGSMVYLDSYPEYQGIINPEAYGVSSNTDLARSLMA